MRIKKKQHNLPFSVDDTVKILHRNLDFTATEQYKLLRTNLGFTLPIGEICPVIGVTSSIRGEGKSTTSINLSYVLAEKGYKVLLIDGDLRCPSIAKKMEIERKKGLTDFLMGEFGDLDCFRSSLLENWYVIPSGIIPPNPSELLGSERMRALLTEFRKSFDYIVIDLPPVNPVSDAVAVADAITGMLVVIREDYINKKELSSCFRQLELSHVKILGCVMNCAKYGQYSRYRYGMHKALPRKSERGIHD